MLFVLSTRQEAETCTKEATASEVYHESHICKQHQNLTCVGKKVGAGGLWQCNGRFWKILPLP